MKVTQSNTFLCQCLSSDHELRIVKKIYQPYGVLKLRMPHRLMTISPFYPCGKPCSRGTHKEAVENLALFSSTVNGITMESRLRISIPRECFQFFIRIESSITGAAHFLLSYALVKVFVALQKQEREQYRVISENIQNRNIEKC